MFEFLKALGLNPMSQRPDFSKVDITKDTTVIQLTEVLNKKLLVVQEYELELALILNGAIIIFFFAFIFLVLWTVVLIYFSYKLYKK